MTAAQVAMPKVGVQLYTLRSEIDVQRPSALGRALELAAGAGYHCVELFGGFLDATATTVRTDLERLDLEALAAHVPIEQLEARSFTPALADYRTIGCARLVCPWLPPARRGGVEVYRALGASLDAIGSELALEGFSLGYHNHDFELDVEGAEGSDGTDGLQTIFDRAQAAHLFAELDVYWLAWAGRDPAAYLRALGRRVTLLHLKDGELLRTGRRPAEPARFTPLGDGDVDLGAVIEAALETGVQALIVEQDYCEGPPHVAIERSLRHLERLLADATKTAETE